jgi:hypothetical protein
MLFLVQLIKVIGARLMVEVILASCVCFPSTTMESPIPGAPWWIPIHPGKRFTMKTKTE